MTRNAKQDTPTNADQLAEKIARLALDKKAEDILKIDVRGITDMTDFFIICSADTEIQVKAIADAIRKGTPHKPIHLEGYENLRWILLDYIDTVVHIMRTSDRNYYNLEKLWADAPTTEINDATQGYAATTPD